MNNKLDATTALKGMAALIILLLTLPFVIMGVLWIIFHVALWYYSALATAFSIMIKP